MGSRGPQRSPGGVEGQSPSCRRNVSYSPLKSKKFCYLEVKFAVFWHKKTTTDFLIFFLGGQICLGSIFFSRKSAISRKRILPGYYPRTLSRHHREQFSWLKASVKAGSRWGFGRVLSGIPTILETDRRHRGGDSQ